MESKDINVCGFKSEIFTDILMHFGHLILIFGWIKRFSSLVLTQNIVASVLFKTKSEEQ